MKGIVKIEFGGREGMETYIKEIDTIPLGLFALNVKVLFHSQDKKVEKEIKDM